MKSGSESPSTEPITTVSIIYTSNQGTDLHLLGYLQFIWTGSEAKNVTSLVQAITSIIGYDPVFQGGSVADYDSSLRVIRASCSGVLKYKQGSFYTNEIINNVRWIFRL